MDKSQEQLDAEKLQQIASVANTPAGKMLIANAKSSCTASIASLIGMYRESDPSMFIPHIAKLEANLNLYRTLTGAQSSYEELMARILEEERD